MTADTRQAVTSAAKYEAQIMAINHQLERMISLHKATDAAGFAGMSTAAAQASRTFRDAAASTGMFEVQQLRLNSASDDYIKKLKQQKMSFREMSKARKVASAAYKEQLALENMSLRQNVGSNRTNKGVYDIVVPKNVSAELDTAGKRLAFMNAELKSGAHQMVNWGKNTQWAGRQLMVGFTMPIAAFGAAAGVMAYQVDKELTRIQKVYDTTATSTMGVEKELAQVRVDSLNAASMAAKEYGAAATDTLSVQAELAATGKQGADLQKSSLEVMRIARLGEVDNDTAINATISLQSVFRDTIKTSDDLSDAFNYMNSIENATSLSTADFATAIPVAASSVKAFGGDVQELGILLTAMKENGIGAAEGANALKATMQRLSRPSKQIREEWEALTGTDITQLVDSSDGLVEVFTKIQQATSGLDADSQRKAFAGLFGSYQVSKMMALTKGMGELQDGVGQVSKAYEIANGSTEDWAATAEKEIQRYQKSVSGMFDITFNTLKLELAKVGEPFVVVATKVLDGVNMILKAFNNLPDGAKWFTAAVIGATALAGTGLMLAGLIANLTGNVIKGAAGLAGFATKMNLVTRESKAGELIAELATKSYTSQASAVQLLTAELNGLAAAQAEANQVMLQHNPAFAGAQGSTTQQMIASKRAQDELEREMAAFRKFDKNGREYYVAPSGPNASGKSGKISRADAGLEAQAVLQSRALAMNDEFNRSAEESKRIGAERTADQQKRNRFAAQAGTLMAVESAAMAASMISSNKLVDDAAQVVMVAGLMAPAYAGLSTVLTGISAKFTAMRAAQAATAAATAATSAATAGSAVAAGGFATAMGAARVALLSLMGPVGWTVAALGALGAIVWKVAQREKEQREQRIRDQKELNSLAQDYTEEAGRSYREYKKLRNLQMGLTEKETTQYDTDLEYFKTNEEGKKKTSAFKDLGSDSERYNAAMETFIDLQVRGGQSSAQAATTVRALYVAAEQGGIAANEAATELSRTLGKIESNDWAGILKTKGANLTDMLFGGSLKSGDEINNYLETEGQQLAGMFSEAIAGAQNKDEAKAIMGEFENAAMSGWQEVWTKNVQTSNLAMAEVKERGITNAAELAEFYNTATDTDISLFEQDSMFTIDPAALGNLQKAMDIEKQLVSAYAKDFGALNGDVTKFAQLMKDVTLQAATLTLGEADAEVKSLAETYGRMDQLGSVLGVNMGEVATETGVAKINAFNLAHGFLQGKDLAQAVYFFTNRIKADLYGGAAGANALAGNLNNAKGAASGLRGILAGLNAEAIAEAGQNAISGMQDDMADGWRDNLESSQEAASDALDNRLEGEREALGNRLDAESDALDAAWDGKRKGLENYWDARVKGVENAIEAEEKAEEKRVKMFDAEIARINKLADMANTNIDFNVALNEGNLDEAAKIANTAQAKETQSVFERERDAGSEKSAKRVDKLNDRKEGMEEKKDAAMEAFDKRAEAAKAYFDNYRSMEEDSLAASQEAQKKSLETRQEAEKKNLDRILKTFLAYTPRNKKELEKHAADLGLSLDAFGQAVLKPMSMTWGQWFKQNMRDGLTNAALEAETADVWKQFGEKTKNEMLSAWGFKSEKEFFDFINGKPLAVEDPASQGGDAIQGSEKITATEKTGPAAGKKTQKPVRHGGGPVVGGVDSREGVAKNYKGLHPSEIDITARKGEYIMNEDAAKKYAPQLDAMNAGRGVGGKFGMAGRLGGAMVASIAKGLMARGMERAKAAKKAASKAGMAGGTSGGGGFSAGGYTEGQGGWQHPTVPGLGWSNTHDYRAPTGTPIYALSDGVIADSRAITSGGSPGNGTVTPSGVPYRSYGETIGMRAADGSLFRYAHLSARYVGAGQSVKGGALLGRTGVTGNATGPHLHMDVNGNYNASGYLASRGVGLRKGAEYVKFDNTFANLHRGESVLTKNLTSKMHEGVERFANGDSSEYNVNVNIYGAGKNADEIARKVEKIFERKANRRPVSRKAGSKR